MADGTHWRGDKCIQTLSVNFKENHSRERPKTRTLENVKMQFKDIAYVKRWCCEWVQEAQAFLSTKVIYC